MTDFIIRVLKWLAALVVALFVLFMLGLFLLGMVVAALQPAPATMQSGSVLVLDLGFNLTDQPASDEPELIIRDVLAGELLRSASLRQVLDALERARTDADVGGLLIRGNLLLDGSGGSLASLRELRRSIAAFGEDKPVWAHLDNEGLRDYYLKSAATRVVADPHAYVDFRGLRAETIYFGEAFERLGIGFQIEAFEEFKTAGEAFVRGRMSQAEREQLAALVSDLWKAIVADIAESRSAQAADLDALAGREVLVYAEEVINSGLADALVSEDELIDELATVAGYDPDAQDFLQFDFLDYIAAGESVSAGFLGVTGSTIGLIHAEGLMLDGESEEGVVGAATLVRHLREMRDDPEVKAVVLRINSPGGSASAASKIVREIELTREEKPVVASLGGVAASGGYMIAAPADQIFTEPLTITGSIGVVIMLPNVEGLAEKLSLHFEGVETHPFAGTFSLSRAKSAEEMRQVRALAARTYSEFLELVAANRELSFEEVRAAARGRVWSGKAAVGLRLADEEGGLGAAVQRAADLAGIGDSYTVYELPEAVTLDQRIRQWLTGAGITARPSSPAGLRGLAREVERELRRLSVLDDPHGQYALLPYTLTIN